jgi:hypothetical protein
MRCVLARARLVPTDGEAPPPASLDLLARELPSVRIELTDACGVCDAIVEADAWTAATDLDALDAAVESSPSDALSIRGTSEQLALVATQVLGRYQRFLDRRNSFSSSRSFDVILRGHRGVYGADVAGCERSLDRWQWLLRVAPNASVAAQIAALFRNAGRHIERVTHAAGYADAIAVRAMRLAHDNDPEVEDAEGLSFLSLESAGASRRDVTAIAAALRPQARAKLPFVHLTPQVRHWLFESIAA